MRKIIIFILLIGCGFWAYYLYNSSDITHKSYTSYDEIEFEKGWIPRWIPKDSFDISETHNIDTNKLFIIFKSKQYKKFLSTCKKLDLKNIPQNLANFNLKDDIKKYKFFTCKKNENYIVAFNLGKKEFYIFDK